MRTLQTNLIADNQSLVSAQFKSGTPIQTYDDGYGPLFILRDSMGVQGIIRAQSWEDAYGIAEDEMFPDCDLSMDEIVKEYGFKREHIHIIRDSSGIERRVQLSDYPFSETGCSFVRWETIETPDSEAWSENELFREAYGFRPNGARDHKVPMSHIYAKDLNGESLDALTAELVVEIGITLNIQTNK